VKLEEAIKSNKFKSEMQKAGLNVLYTAWWLKTLSANELKIFGLTHEQYNVIRILKGKHPEKMCVKDIASRMIEKSSNVPRIIDRLFIKKLIKRTQSETDGRHTLIELTASGIALLEKATVKLDEIMANSVTLSNAEAETLNLLLEKVRTKE